MRGRGRIIINKRNIKNKEIQTKKGVVTLVDEATPKKQKEQYKLLFCELEFDPSGEKYPTLAVVMVYVFYFCQHFYKKVMA